jgi:phosphohistidine phosphatase
VPRLELYLIRHGIAAERGDAESDDVRPLTAEGIARLGAEAAGLVALKMRRDLILTSPLVRAKQTAEMLAEDMRYDVPIVETRALAPFGSPADVMAELVTHRPLASIALVGHEPAISDLAARLLHAQAPFAFKKGAVCRLDFTAYPPEGIATLSWFATPKMLRLIGRRD